MDELSERRNVTPAHRPHPRPPSPSDGEGAKGEGPQVYPRQYLRKLPTIALIVIQHAPKLAPAIV